MTIAEPEIQTPTAAAPREPGPLPKRILDTFMSPGELFSRITPEAAPWVGPAVLVAAVMALAFALVPLSAYEAMMQEQLRNMPRQPGQAAPDAATMATIGRIFGTLTMLFYPFIGALVVGGLLKLLFGTVMGGEATFGQYLSVYTHAALILALGSLVNLPVIIASGDVMRQLNLSLLIPDGDPSSFLFKFLMQFGIFNLWQYAVIAVGVLAVNRGKISAAGAWGGVSGLYLATALLGALMQRT